MQLNNLLFLLPLLAVVVLIGLYLVYLFNRLFRYMNAAEANLSQIQVAMKKRLDMIDQLLGAVKGYVQYERDVFETVAEMRSKVMTAGPQGLDEIDRGSRRLFGALLALAEDYPDLKADRTVQTLMNAIISVEDEIARHRYTYNNIVQEFNTMVDSVPSNMVAGMMGLDKLNYLEFEEEVERAPIIKGISGDE